MAVAGLVASLKSELQPQHYVHEFVAAALQPTDAALEDNEHVLTGAIKYSPNGVLKAQVIQEAIAMLDQEHSGRLSGRPSGTKEARQWARLQSNRLQRLWFYVLKLKRGSPAKSHRAAVQRLKDLCVLVVEPSAAHALPLQALLLEGFAMRGGGGQS